MSVGSESIAPFEERRGREKHKTAVRVGIVTFHHVTNFGAVLQAYALCRALKELGCDARVIDYRPEYLVGPYQRLGRRPTVILDNLIRNWRFNHFRRAFIPRTDRIYRSEEELRRHPPDADVYVCGSDQVWNLRILKERLDAGFFLAFGRAGMRRVAYAPSFGDVTSFGRLQDAVAEVVASFDAVSAREGEGQTLIRELTGREAPLVLDPSFLVEDYSEATERPAKAPEQYILAYPIEYSPQFPAVVQRVRQLLGLPVVNVGIRPLPTADLNHIRLGPSQWLGWMQGASFVCTNSFHGTAYSIIFKKDFVAFAHQRQPRLNARFNDLLQQAGLGERLLVDPAQLGDGAACLQPVNYDVAGALLRAAIAQSVSYLRNAVFAGQR